MKKKVLFIGILLIALCLILAGCGKENDTQVTDDTDKDVEISTVTDEPKTTVDSSDLDFVELYSDDTKLVFANGSVKMVFTYSGDKITSYSTYLDCNDAAAAKLALAEYNKDPDEDVEKAYTKGQYLVLEYKDSEYMQLSVSELKLAMSYLQELKK